MGGEQRCVCGHRFSIHRLNRQIGNRNECWALNDNQLVRKWCLCRQFVPARPGAERAREDGAGEGQ